MNPLIKIKNNHKKKNVSRTRSTDESGRWILPRGKNMTFTHLSPWKEKINCGVRKPGQDKKKKDKNNLERLGILTITTTKREPWELIKNSNHYQQCVSVCACACVSVCISV